MFLRFQTGETFEGGFEVSVEQQPGSVPVCGPGGYIPEHVFEPEPGETQLLDYSEDGAMVYRAAFETMARLELVCPYATSGRCVRFEDRHLQTCVGEEAGTDEPVVAATDYCDPGHREEWTPLSPARAATVRASARLRPICWGSSIVVNSPSASSRRPSTHTLLTDRGRAQ